MTTLREVPAGSAFPMAEYTARLDRARAMLQQEGWAAVVCVAPETIYYFSGHEAHTHFSDQALIVFADSSEPVMIMRDCDEGVLREACWVPDVRFYRLRVTDPVDFIDDALRRLRKAGARIGLETRSNSLPLSYGRRVLGKLEPNFTVEDASAALGRLRIIKSELELVHVRRAAKMTRAGVDTAFVTIRPGVTELDVAAEVDYAVRKQGSEYPGMPVWFSSGNRTKQAHCTPTSRIISSSEPVRFCFAAVSRRYHVSVYHTVHVGEPSREFREVYEQACEAQRALIAGVKAGAPTRTAASAAAAVLRGHGLLDYMKGRWGYGVGIGFPPSWLEPLDVTEESSDVFAPGQVFCLHISLEMPEKQFGVILGGDYLLTETGVEALDETGFDLVTLG